MAGLASFRDRPSGTIRINAGKHPAETILWPAMIGLAVKYPEIRVELAVDQKLTDIVAEGFDAGVRLGEQVADGMIAVPIGPAFCMAVVGSRVYFKTRPEPRTPHDLTSHNCINLRLPTYGGLYAWEFEKNRRALKVRVGGQLTVNDTSLALDAALKGLGLAYLPEDKVNGFIASGKLTRVLGPWCPPFPGYHLYYPSRRQPTKAFTLLVEALRYRP